MRFIRELLEVINVGPTPPPILYLSDGGHVENLGILPLLKKKLTKIVVVDGGDLEELGIAGDLITALKNAREKLHCSFTGMNGRDVYEDLRAKVINRPASKQPRSYRFKVQYYDYTDEGEEQMVGEGEVLYILPRHPKYGLSGERKSWDEITDGVKIDIEADLWPVGEWTGSANRRSGTFDVLLLRVLSLFSASVFIGIPLRRVPLSFHCQSVLYTRHVYCLPSGRLPCLHGGSRCGISFGI